MADTPATAAATSSGGFFDSLLGTIGTLGTAAATTYSAVEAAKIKEQSAQAAAVKANTAGATAAAAAAAAAKPWYSSTGFMIAAFAGIILLVVVFIFTGKRR